MRFRILGPLEVLSPDGWTAISAAKWRSLLACLLVRPGQLVPTDALIDELWGENPPHTANNLVSIYVHRLKKVIGDTEGKALLYRAPGYMLRVSEKDLDSEVFELLVGDGRGALDASDADRAAALLREALALWRGPLLADVPRTALLATQADRADELRLAATELRIEADLVCGRAAQVIPELRGLVGEHPLREGFWALLIRALEAAGRRAEALETYSHAQQAISDELGVDPGTELQRLFRELLAADSATVTPSADASSTSTDAPSRSTRSGHAAPGTRRRPSPSAAPGAPRPGSKTAAVPARAPSDPARRGAAVSRDGDDQRDAPAPSANARLGDAEDGAPGSIAIGTFDDLVTPPAAAPAPEEPPQAPSSAAGLFPAPAQLPADIGDFTGRETHVAHLSALLRGNAKETNSGAVRIAVVSGTAGLGKTTLAVHAAHEVSVHFPDGQLYVDLLGASPQTAAPGEVLARFLRDLGVKGDAVPTSDDERAALYRTTLAGRRVLVVLDNARDAAQVRHLLPGTASCAVLITTRNRTPDLAGLRYLDLNVLEDTEALELFSRIVGEERAAAEPDATGEILVACAGLPLAVRICAARLAARRNWQIATLAGRLRNEQRRLDELKIGDLEVRSSFQVSYDSIRTLKSGADPARAFRLLGLWQGESISLPAAAALLGQPDDEVAEMLEGLVDVNLLESPAPDWYRFHDLLKVYAMERAEAEEPEAARDETMNRMLWWYLDTAQAAADTVSPQRYQVRYEPRVSGHPPLTFGSVEAALAWYDDERANIVVATRQAAATGLHEVACRLPSTLWPLFNRRANWTDCVTTYRVAAESAAKTGDRLGEAWALNQLGFALASLRDSAAFGPLERALAVRQEFGDKLGEAHTAIALGEYFRAQGPGEDAVRYLRRAVTLLEPMGAISLRSVALNNLGEVYRGLGELDAAAECYLQALDIGREIGGHVEGHALNGLGLVYMRQQRFNEAVARLGEAVFRHRTSGDRGGEAWALLGLGAAQAETGSRTEARASLTEALRIFQQIGNQEQAAETGALLASLSAGHG
jgi:DNA-binding SARP family transcriptional activator/tetratricopeptide (TPR) repeat protein